MYAIAVMRCLGAPRAVRLFATTKFASFDLTQPVQPAVSGNVSSLSEKVCPKSKSRQKVHLYTALVSRPRRNEGALSHHVGKPGHWIMRREPTLARNETSVKDQT